MSDHQHHLGHDDAARSAVDDAHLAVDDANDAVDDARDAARQAVADAREAVVSTSISLDRLAAMLQRHYRLGVIAVATAVVVGGMLVVLVVGLRNTQETVDVQTKANEVVELRGQVTTREGDHRLCVVALGASRPADVAEQICKPVLGEDYAALRAKLDRLERRLVTARNGG